MRLVSPKGRVIKKVEEEKAPYPTLIYSLEEKI